jgi:nucleotide-binding universal stress UspA family protein
MFKKIIVGIDDSDRAMDALALAQALKTVHAELIVVHVQPGPAPLDRFLEGVERMVKRRTDELLERAHEALGGSANVRLIAVSDSSPARALTTLAESEGADLIVIGSTRQGSIGRLGRGSVADRLLEGSPCAVAVTPHSHAARLPESTFSAIGVAYDGSAESGNALAAAAAVAGEHEAKLQVIGVVDVAATRAPLAYGYGVLGDALDYESMNQAFRERIERATSELQVAAEPIVLDGDPARELIRATKDLTLLLIGSRSYGPMSRVLLGSVSARVLRKAACPVIVVPRAAQTATGQRQSAMTADVAA